LAATAPKLKAAQQPAPAVPRTGQAVQGKRAAAVQGSLFTAREAAKVVPISGETPAGGGTLRRRRVGEQRRTNDAVVEQQSFAFAALSAQERRKLKTQVEAVIFCDAPVATARHRALAGAIDLSLVLFTAAGFYALYFQLSGGLAWTKATIPYLVGGPLLLLVFYDLFWALAGSDTPGHYWTRMRVLDFDGHRPTVRQRLFRVLGSLMSFMAIGLGYIWLFVDEESLTWQDHISKTFPTPAV
jgi:uncharacterized RDD family membrane protein YckC